MSILIAVFVVFSFKTLKSYQEARLICENPILSVDMVIVAKSEEAASYAVNVVVSGFGILLDDKPYQFGHEGVRLTDAAIDRKSIVLSFGESEKLKERLLYETGIMKAVNGW